MSLRSDLARHLLRLPLAGTILAWKAHYPTVLRNNRVVRHQMGRAGILFGRALDLAATVPRPVGRRMGRATAGAAHRWMKRTMTPESWASMRANLGEPTVAPSAAELDLRRLFQDAAAMNRRCAYTLAAHASPAAAAQDDRASYYEAVKLAGQHSCALELSGEERVDALLDILARCERVLSKTLLFAFALLELAAGNGLPELSENEREFGSLRSNIQKHCRISQYPGILPPWLNHMRNSACHGKHEYLEADDALVWWDRKPADTRETIDALDLWERVGEVVRLPCVDLPQAAQRHVLLSSPLMEALESPEFVLRTVELFVLYCSDDPIQQAEASRSFRLIAEDLEKRTREFFEG